MEEVGGGVEVMDRTAGVRICGEWRFRELENEYLQKQARLWLSEVLKRRLDEDQSISDMLADGDLLFDAFKVMWKLLKEKGLEVEDLRMFSRTTKSKKHIGKYMPYSNVDAFLKICKFMGLTGVDLFSPSDVVERRDTRKVCMCLRSLSKKARSMDINVPDFDIVTCTITMPTNLIGCIRRSLELSQCGSVSSDSLDSCNDSDLLCLEASCIASSSYDLHSEVSDDADSSVSVGYYRLPSRVPFDTALLRKSESLSSIESFSLSNNTNLDEALAHFGICDHVNDKHEFISLPSVKSSECAVDSSALPCFSDQTKSDDSDFHTGSLLQDPHNGDPTIPVDGAQDLRICFSNAEICLDESTIGKTSTKNSTPVSDLECREFFCREEQRQCANMFSEKPISSQVHNERELRYNEARLGTSCSRHTNVLNFDFYDTNIKDDQDHVESQFGIVFNPVPTLVNKCGNVYNDSCDVVHELVAYSDRLESKMEIVENNLSVSYPDFQSYASGSQDTEASDCNFYLSSQVTSDYGDGEAELLSELKDWSVDNEDLENVHLSIIERFLSTTTCSNTETNICSEILDESDCLNLDGDDVDLKPVLPFRACERFPYFLNESFCDDKLVEDLSFSGAVENKGVIGFPDEVHQANFVLGAKETTNGIGSPCDQEAGDKALIQCSTNDREFYVANPPLGQTPLDTVYVNQIVQDEKECLEAKLIEAEVFVLKDPGTAKSNQSKTRKSPILKSIMGGAVLLGVLAFFLNTRASKKDQTEKPELDHSHISGGNNFSSHKTNNGVMKKGVYAAAKLNFS